MSKNKEPQQPSTRLSETTDVFHGVSVSDPYRWLEETNPETSKWIDEQNNYSRSYLDSNSAKDVIKERLEELYHVDTIGIPSPYGEYYFFMERKADQDLSVLYIRKRSDKKPQVLIDQNTLSEDGTTTIHGWYPSQDGTLMAYGLSEAGNDKADLRIMNTETGQDLEDFIPADVYPCAHASVVWSPDNKGFWYTRRHPDTPKGEEKFHRKLYYHVLGKDFSDDKLIFGEDLAKEDSPAACISEDGRYLLINVAISSKGKRNEIYLYDHDNPQKGFVPVVNGIEASFYGFLHRGVIYIMTNYEAPLWKIFSLSVGDIEKPVEERDVIIPESVHIINDFTIVQDKLFVKTMENVSSSLRVYNLKGENELVIELPPLGSLSRMSADSEGDELFFGFSSLVMPLTIYRYDIKSGSVNIFKESNTKIDLSAFTVSQRWCSSKDGTKIPLFLVHKKNVVLDGKNPVMLYGYGGFNISVPSSFRKDIIPFLENGGVYVIANIRGGGEYGEKWHKAGVLEKKQNVFDDFAAAARWLIKEKYTKSDRLAIFGWSNGGLLTGVTLIQHPELCKAVIVGAPVIDMIRYHLFFGGRHWIPDYGCAENENDFKFLIDYSPYHTIKAGERYPSTLIVTAEADDRVHPMHAYKFTARLQAAQNADNPILLLVERKAGHSGAASTSNHTEQFSNIWAFVFKELKMGK